MSARGRDPGAGPQAAGDAAARHDAARHAAACDDAACDAAARDDWPADADATLKSQTFVAATALIMINESIAILSIILCNVPFIYNHPSFIMVLRSS